MFEKTLGMDTEMVHRLIMTPDHLDVLYGLFIKIEEYSHKRGFIKSLDVNESELELIDDFLNMLKDDAKR